MNENKRKTVGTIFGIILFICCVLFVTYAWYVWRSEYININANIVEETSDVDFSPDTLSVSATDIGPILDYKDDYYYTEANKGKYLAYADFTATNKGDTNYRINAILNITSISDNLKDDSFEYVLLKKNTANGVYNIEVTSGDFSTFAVGDNVITNDEMISGNSTNYYRFVAYIDGNQYNNNTLMSGSLNSYLKLSSSDLLLSGVEPGSYVYMTPTKSTYTTDTSKTGYTSTQTIYPKELNLWRIINVNDDGTVDMISNHVSSIGVYFTTKTGYQNLVGYLNVLASQYENSNYTASSRYFGYNGQTEYITDTSKFTIPAPWTCSTGESCNPIESQGGGDTLYTTDYNLVNTVLGTLEASNPSGDFTSYWIASRHYEYESSYFYGWGGRNVTIDNNHIGLSGLYVCDDGENITRFSRANAIRPILTLQSSVYITGGSGTYEEPYTISNAGVNNVNVSFDVNGGSDWDVDTCDFPSDLDGTSCTKSVVYNDAYGDLPTPVKEGYKFLGWYTTASGGSNVALNTNVTNSSNHTLYAHWQALTYTVSYNANNGSGAPSNQTKQYGVNLTLSSTVPTRDGYKFLGWSTSSDATTPTYEAGGTYSTNADVTLYAVWTLRDVNIVNINIDGSSSNTLPTSGTYTLSSYSCSKGSTLTWDTYSKSLTYGSGAKVGDNCSVNFTSSTSYPKLNTMEVGSYVAYTGSGGKVGSTSVACKTNGSASSSTASAETEAPNSCNGQNAREDLDSSVYTYGYCYSANYKYYTTGWRIAYIDSNNKPVIVSAGSPECNSRTSSTANVTYMQTANAKALKYCNTDYVDGNCTCTDSDSDGLCDSASTDAWAINDTDFYNMTKAISGVGKRLCNSSSSLGDSGGTLGSTLYCNSKYSYKECGYNNSLIDNGGYYWFAAQYSSSNADGVLWNPYSRHVNRSSNTYAYGLRPVISLSSTVYVTGGSGTMDDPYTIGN